MLAAVVLVEDPLVAGGSAVVDVLVAGAASVVLVVDGSVVVVEVVAVSSLRADRSASSKPLPHAPASNAKATPNTARRNVEIDVVSGGRGRCRSVMNRR